MPKLSAEDCASAVVALELAARVSEELGTQLLNYSRAEAAQERAKVAEEHKKKAEGLRRAKSFLLEMGC